MARAIFESAIPVVSAVGHEIDTTIADFVADLRAPTPTAAAELVVPELAAMAERVEEGRLRLLRALRASVDAWGERLESLRARLQALGPLNQLRREQQRLDFLVEGLEAAMKHRLELGAGRVGSLASRLEALSPLAVLQRGYSITRTAQGRVVRAAREVKAGDILLSRLADGEVRSVVS
ncbi:MAG: Exodeoxyribonuclease 7 large subunit [Planctomycetes bacterium]|nr:Exodeoxyribonuclease 7 large subunit [Planctomycetota bacterium]